MFRTICAAIFMLVFEQVECTISYASSLQDLVNWNYQLYTSPLQRSAWRWPNSWAEICSFLYKGLPRRIYFITSFITFYLCCISIVRSFRFLFILLLLLFNRQSLYDCSLAGSQNSTGHLLFTVPPKTRWLCGMYWLLPLSALKCLDFRLVCLEW